MKKNAEIVEEMRKNRNQSYFIMGFITYLSVYLSDRIELNQVRAVLHDREGIYTEKSRLISTESMGCLYAFYNCDVLPSYLWHSLVLATCGEN